jgi:hypothetical protein
VVSYFIIICTIFAGLAAAPWWFAAISGSVLSLISIWEQQKLRARFVAVGASDVLTASALASLATGCVTTGAAYVLGRMVGVALFGV